MFSKENWHDPIPMRLDQAIPKLLQEIYIRVTNEMKLLCCTTRRCREQHWLWGDVLLSDWMGARTPFVVYISEPHRRIRTLKTDRLLLVASKRNLLKKHRPCCLNSGCRKRKSQEFFSLFSLSFKIKNTSPFSFLSNYVITFG